MAGIMQNVSILLSGAGYRTGYAGPGRPVTEVTEPVLALSVEQVNTDRHMATVRVSVVSPLALGAKACEDEALKVCRILRNAGAVCELQPYKMEAKTEVFIQPVMATFYGDVLSGSWLLGQGCDVRFDADNLDQVVSFTSWRKIKADGQVIGNMIWRFRVEEHLDGIQAQIEPIEPFVITVTHGDAEEIFQGCRLSLHKRVLTDGGIVQIREGTATSRTVSE